VCFALAGDSPGFRSAAQPALSFAARYRGQKNFSFPLSAKGEERERIAQRIRGESTDVKGLLIDTFSLPQ